MKKLFLIALIIGSLAYFKYNNSNKIIIPDDAIRFRVIASSDSNNDQQIKEEVLTNLSSLVLPLTANKNNINEVRKTIKSNMLTFDNNVKSTLKNNKHNTNFTVDYGLHYFPNKEYKGVVYEAGNYESLVVTLGNGNGKNFWCVLFPPLCLLEADNKNSSDVEYKFFVKDLLDKYF